MTITLALDASTYAGTAAVFEDTTLLADGEAAMRGRDAERLFPLVLEVLERAGRELGDVEQLVCGAGPGSFTSLRIAASITKGVAMGRRIPIRAPSSLALMVGAHAPLGGADGRYLAALDALRGEHYVELLELRDGLVRPLREVTLLSSGDLPAAARQLEAQLVGPGWDDDWRPGARGAMRVHLPAPVDLASWEPDYGRKAEAQARWEADHGRALSL